MMLNSRRDRGFTLIEVLVATTLLAVMVGLITGCLFSVGRSARMGQADLDRLDNERLALRFLRARISEAVPLTERKGRDERVYLEGRPDSLRFVGHLPAHRGGGGLQFLEIAVDEGAEEAELVLWYRNAWPEIDFSSDADHVDWEHATLMRRVTDFRVRYFGSEDGILRPEWSAQWVDRRTLPSLIQLSIEFADGRQWPELSFAVRALTAEGQPRLVREFSD